MTERHILCIEDNFDTLAERLNVNEVLNKFRAAKILTRDEWDELRRLPAGRERAESFLDRLTRKEDKAFYILIEALEGTCQAHLANILKNAGTC